MSYPQDGPYTGGPATQAGSVKRARELAEANRAAGGGRRDFGSIAVPPLPRQMAQNPPLAQPSPRRMAQQPFSNMATRMTRPQAPPGLQDKNGQRAMPISRPTQVPQWPLADPLASPTHAPGSPPYQPPPGRSQPPQRPPRPSRVPSMLDGSKVQEHTPVFQYTPQTGRESGQDLSSVPATPSTNADIRSTQSSVGSIPDFPMPTYGSAAATGPPRRSVGLGPPPSSRRGNSSFYSNLSYVSPIPEESPRTRSNASYASSAAMPNSFGSQSPVLSPRSRDGVYDDVIPEEPGQVGLDDDGEASRLVRSASIGKRGMALLVNTTTPAVAQRPAASPMQAATSFLGDASSGSSEAVPTVKTPVDGPLTADSIINAYNAATAVDSPSPNGNSPVRPPSRPYSRLSAIRRPPRLDLDAVKKAESRGSLTSLPDLIRRATELAASLERGRRPASRFENLDDYPMASDPEKDRQVPLEKHRSGLSDMLAAFPPPAAANRNTNSQNMRQQGGVSWPMPINFRRGQNGSTPRDENPMSRLPTRPPRKGRRCCGLPLYGFLLVLLVILILIAAAVVIPVEFFVIHKQNSTTQSAQSDLSQCQNQVICQNGGTNVVNNGACSCICTGGFTGLQCTVPGAIGCTTTSFDGTDTLSNVTLGDALPRLIEQAQTNFSIPLSATNIISKLNAGNLSCIAQNALVTFDGENQREADGSAEVTAPTGNANNAAAVTALNGVVVTTITIMAGQGTTFTLFTDATAATTVPPAGTTAGCEGGCTDLLTPTSTTTVTTTITPTAAAPSATFTVTEETLDFARVAVLFILQQEDLQSAETAQGDLQLLFTSASQGSQGVGSGISIDQASNVTVGGTNSIDLVRFVIDTGPSTVGGTAGYSK